MQGMGREEEFYIRKSKSGVFATNKETHPLWIVVFPEIIGIVQSPILHVQCRQSIRIDNIDTFGDGCKFCRKRVLIWA